VPWHCGSLGGRWHLGVETFGRVRPERAAAASGPGKARGVVRRADTVEGPLHGVSASNARTPRDVMARVVAGIGRAVAAGWPVRCAASAGQTIPGLPGCPRASPGRPWPARARGRSAPDRSPHGVRRRARRVLEAQCCGNTNVLVCCGTAGHRRFSGTGALRPSAVSVRSAPRPRAGRGRCSEADAVTERAREGPRSGRGERTRPKVHCTAHRTRTRRHRETRSRVSS